MLFSVTFTLIFPNDSKSYLSEVGDYRLPKRVAFSGVLVKSIKV